jgi:translocation and assembly module TamA
MMKRLRIIVETLTIVWFAGVVSVCAKDNDSMIALPFYVVGLHTIEPEALYEALDIEVAPRWMFWKDHTPKIKRGLAEHADTTLRAFFDSEGFYDAQFFMHIYDRNVTLEVNEGEPVRVADINISSDYNLSHIVTFEKGEIFRAEKFIEIKSAIVDAMLDEGYCSYDMDTKAFVDLEKHRVDLRYILHKGDPCVFGKATVKGLQTIDERIVLSRVRAKEGRRFSKEAVQHTSTAVYGLKAFDSVVIDVNRKLYNVVPVDIKVQEMQRPYHIELGAGYDTYVGARVHATFYKHNFLGNAKQLKLRLAWSQQETVAILDYYQPVLFEISGYPFDLGLSGGYSDLEYDGFRETKLFATAYLRYEGDRFDFTGGLSAETIEISHSDDDEDKLPPYAYDTFTLVYPYFKLIYDGRDSKLDPKEGYYVMGYTEYGLPADTDASRYLKMEFEARYIHTFFGKLTTAAVGKIGTIEIYRDSAGGIPESKKFFGGGAYSNRAYGFREIGVIVSPTEDLIDGALSMANLTLEADYPIYGKLYGAVFTDNTMLNAESYDFSGEVITSAGVGVRYLTPVGPFKLDVGFNVHDPSQYGIIFQIGQSF